MLDIATVQWQGRQLSKHDVVSRLAQHGAILLKGFDGDLSDFVALTNSFGKRFSGDPTKLKAHRWEIRLGKLGAINRRAYQLLDRFGNDDGTRDAPRQGSGINPHNENTFLPAACPDLLWMYCRKPASQGGDSVLCDGTDVLAELSDAARSYFSTTAVRYELEFSPVKWRAVYRLKHEDELRRLLDGITGLEYDLSRSGDFRYRFDTSQLAATFFGGIPALKTNLLSRQPFEKLVPKRRESTADGDPVSMWVMEELLQVVHRCQTRVALSAGDILMLDNSRVMHGRTPFTDKSRSVATRCTWLDMDD